MWDGGEQFAHVAGFGRTEHGVAGAFLDDLSGSHDDDAVTQQAHHIEVMGDEQIAHTQQRLEILEQIKHHGLDRHVQCSGGLVQDNKLGPQRNGAGDADAGLLAAGQLMREAIEQLDRQADLGGKVLAPRPQFGGFLDAAGEVLVDGKGIAGPGTDRGVVFQEYALFPWLTVTQNIRYGLEMTGVARREREETVRRLVRTIGLEGFEHRFPRELSGGMKQRVAIARTLAYDPNILLLDEPFGALDAQTRETMQDELLRLWQATRKTVVMVTHDVNEAVYLSDRVLVMSQRPGRMVAKFSIAIDRSGNRETTMLNADFNAVRNEVWLAVRRQVAATIAA